MKYLVAGALVFLLVACTPVMDPARWDDTMFCKTTHACVVTAHAAKPVPVFWQGGSSERSDPVEQESPNFFFCGGSAGPIYCAFDPSTWVLNTTPCIWDVDEYSIHNGYGDLPGGANVAQTDCMISDGFDNYGQDDHIVIGTVVSTSPNLQVVLTSSRGDRIVPVASPNGRTWKYSACTIDRTPGPYPSVDGSNGGTGIRVDYTLTITNASSRTARNTSAKFQLGYDSAGLACA